MVFMLYECLMKVNPNFQLPAMHLIGGGGGGRPMVFLRDQTFFDSQLKHTSFYQTLSKAVVEHKTCFFTIYFI